jgi:hypothetical protein
MNSINVKIALSAILVLAASAAQANDYLGHRDKKALGLDSYATVHRVAPASPASGAWDSAGQPTGPTCPLLEGYPDCH